MRILIPITLFIGLLGLAVFLFTEQPLQEPKIMPEIEPEPDLITDQMTEEINEIMANIDTSFEASICARISENRLRTIFSIPQQARIRMNHSGNKSDCTVNWYVDDELKGGGNIIRLKDTGSPYSVRSWKERAQAAEDGRFIAVPDLGKAAYYNPEYGNLTISQPGYMVEIAMTPDYDMLAVDVDHEKRIEDLVAVYHSVDW